MESKEVVAYGAKRILATIVSKIGVGAGNLKELSLEEIKAISRYDFGVTVRDIAGPVDFHGEARGDFDGCAEVIYINSRDSRHKQILAIVHELAEIIARRERHDEWIRHRMPYYYVVADLLHEIALCTERHTRDLW